MASDPMAVPSRETRRSFLVKSAAALVALSFPLTVPSRPEAYGGPPVKHPRKALVVWYSQTGNTGRCGRLIAKTLEKSGLETRASDYRDIDPAELSAYDLIVAGSPVYYYEVPSNFRQWLKTIPRLDGKAVASYVTFGGEGGNQFNTAVSLLESLANKGGFPTGLDMFGNMSTFAITWSTGSVHRVLKYRNKPDADSYRRIREFARSLTRAGSTEATITLHKKSDFREWIKGGPSIWSTKLLINRHAIDTDRCVKCGFCTRQCPVSAITLNPGIVDTKACIACLACVNNCPEQAMVMEFMHQRVLGYRAFLTEKNIRIHEPEEIVDPAV